MQTLSFCCQLPNGIHARPASALEQKTVSFQSEITLFNKTKARQGNAKSVLALVGTDVALGDECYFQIEGRDENMAYERLKVFIEQEFLHCDVPLAQEARTEQQILPVFLSRSISKIVRGNGVSQGIAKGQSRLIKVPELHSLGLEQPESSRIQQYEELKKALLLAREQLRQDIQKVVGEVANILEAQSQLLDDEDVEACLLEQDQARNSMAALAIAIDELSLPFRESSNEYLRQRELDIKDLGLRIAVHLGIAPTLQLPELDNDTIVVCQGLLTPGQLLTLKGDNTNLQGIVMAEGAETSHTVILARTYSIPLLSASAAVIDQIKNNQSLLLDTRFNALIIEPDKCAEDWLILEKAKLARLTLSNKHVDSNYPVLAPELVLLDSAVASKDEAIKLLTDNLEVNRRTDSATDVEHAIWQREDIFSTALGFSIAIPHCKSLAVKHSSISVMRLLEDLSWGDNVDVRLIIMLTINENEENQHMRIFSVLARKLMHESFREKIRSAKNPNAIVELLKDELSL